MNLPEPWRTALIRAGFTDPRYSDPRPSLNQLGIESGVHTTTVSRMVHGKGVPDPENVARVAKALRRDVVEVSEWVQQARTESQPYEPPAEVHLLSRREQDALTELIRAMAEQRKGVVGDDSQRAAAPTNGVTPTETPAPTGTGPELDGPPPQQLEIPDVPALRGGTKPTDVALPRGPLPKKGQRKKRTGTHAPKDTGDRTT